jgi:hypothetical protein
MIVIDTFEGYSTGILTDSAWQVVGFAEIVQETPTNKALQLKSATTQGINTSQFPTALRITPTFEVSYQRSQAQFRSIDTGDGAFVSTLRSGPAVRAAIVSTQTGPVPLGYQLWYVRSNQTPPVSEFRLVIRYESAGNIVLETLATASGFMSAGDTLALEILQNQLSAYYNGTLLFTVNDSRRLTGTMGIASEHSWGGLTNSVNMRWDNWRGEDGIIIGERKKFFFIQNIRHFMQRRIDPDYDSQSS